MNEAPGEEDMRYREAIRWIVRMSYFESWSLNYDRILHARGILYIGFAL